MVARARQPAKTWVSDYPAIIARWHPHKNGIVRPSEVRRGSHRVLWLFCDKGSDHLWSITATAATRTVQRSGTLRCPFCARTRVAPSNSLARTHPAIARQWHPTRNGALTPNAVTAGADRKVVWLCSRCAGHVWTANLRSRTVQGHGCPFCVGQRAAAANSLGAVAPEIASEWHPTKNGRLSPGEVVPGSHKAVWWRCTTRPTHVWRATVAARARRAAPCPYCAKGRWKLRKVDPLRQTHTLATRFPKIASQWHPTKNGALRPRDVTIGSSRMVWWKCDRGPDHEWRTTPGTRTRGIGCPCCGGRQLSVTNNLSVVAPLIAKQWHPTRNGRFAPSNVVAGSSLRAWWRCEEGHEWQTTVRNRTRRGTTCGECYRLAVRSVTPNALADVAPRVASELHPSKNGKLNAAKLRSGARAVVWWRCSRDPRHQWQATVFSRTRWGAGCPYCDRMTGKGLPFGKTARGTSSAARNALSAVAPRVAHELHSRKNVGITAASLRAGSRLVVWWRCARNGRHQWQASVRSRTRAAAGCPYCEAKTAARVGRSHA